MVAEYKKDFIINVLFIGMFLGLIVLISKFMLAYVFPFVIGIIVALAVQKPAYGLSKRIHIKKQIWAVILTVLICAVTLAAAALGVWAIAGKLGRLIGKIPEYFSVFEKSLNSIKKGMTDGISISGKNSFENAFSGAIDSLASGISGYISSAAAALVSGLPTFLIGSIVTVVASCYIAKDYERLKKFALGIIPEKKAVKIVAVKRIITENAFKFIKGYGIIAAITFLELSAALAILGVNNPILKALMISLIDAMPVLGIGTIIIPWSIAELFKNNYYLGFGLLASYSVIVIIRNFIEPKIIGEQIGINPVFTLIAMFLGLKVAGIIGLLLFPLSLTVAFEYYRRSVDVSV